MVNSSFITKISVEQNYVVPTYFIRTTKIASINLGIKSYGLVIKNESAIYQTGKLPYHSKIQKDIVSHHLKILLQQHPPITYQFQDLLRQIHLLLTHQAYDRLMTSIRLLKKMKLTKTISLMQMTKIQQMKETQHHSYLIFDV